MWNGLDLLWLFPLVGGSMGLASWVRGRRIGELREYLEGFPAPEFLRAPQAEPGLPGRWGIRTFLMVGSGLFLVLALVGLPLGTRLVPVQISPRPVVLIVDVSRSMAVQDIPFGRLNSARLLTHRVISRLSRNPVGLLAAAGETRQLLPSTHDRDLIFRYLDALDTGILTDQGTSLSDALTEALLLMDGEAGLIEPVFLLVSDGEDHGDPSELLALARRIREGGGQVSTISVGTEEGGAVPASDRMGLSLMSGGPRTDTENGTPHSWAHPDLMREVAEAGGGISTRGGDPSAMNQFLKNIEDWGGVESGVVWKRADMDGWPWFLGFSVAALFLDLVLGSIPRGGARPNPRAGQ